MIVETTADRDARYLKLFRDAARRLYAGSKTPRSEYKAMRGYYDELGLSARYSAEIFVVELSNGTIT